MRSPLLSSPVDRRKPEAERFWIWVHKAFDPDGCWFWLGARGNGYGVFIRQNYIPAQAHVWAWEEANGPVPDGLVLDHLCLNHPCVRPSHLEPVTSSVNVKRYHAARKRASSTLH